MVPTKGRPENAVRVAHAVHKTAGRELAALYFLADPGESRWAEYQNLLSMHVRTSGYPPGVYWRQVTASPQRIGPILNQVAPGLAEQYTHLAFMGDDHLPRTERWDEELVRSLGGRPGVAYGNDLFQREALPTMAVLSSDLVRLLGFFVPPGLEHLYLDDFWRRLGQDVGNLVYRDDVIIEHLHPTAGKAAWDDGYFQANDAEQYSRDHAAYDQFLARQWGADLTRLRECLHG